MDSEVFGGPWIPIFLENLVSKINHEYKCRQVETFYIGLYADLSKPIKSKKILDLFHKI